MTYKGIGEYRAITLTAGADTVAGDAEANTIEGVVSALSSERTLDVTDKIDGGEGADTLKVEMKGDFAGFTKDSGFLKNVETVELTNSGTIARTFAAKEVTGVQTYELKGLVNLSDLAAAGVAVNLSDRADGSASVGFATTAVAGSTDALTLGLNNVGTKGATAAQNKAVAVTANGIESLTVNAEGVNVVDLSGVNATTATIAGAGSVTLTATGSNLKSIDASAATGALDLTVNNGSSVNSIAAGSASDVLRVDASKLAVNATVNGGEGDDTLSLSGLNGTTLQLNQSNVETLEITAAAGANVMSGLNTTGLKSLVINAQGSTNTGIASGASLTLAQFAEPDLNLTLSGNTNGSLTATNQGTLTLSTVAEAAETTATTVATAVTATEATAAILNVGARTDLTGAVIASKATELTINVASAKSSAGAELTKLDGDVTANVAKAVTVNAQGRLDTVVTANAAEQASVTTGATATGETDALALKANVAKEVSIKAGGTLDLTNSTLGGAERVTIEATKAVTGNVALSAVNQLNVSGTATTAAVTLGALGATTQDYALTVNASGLKAGFTAASVQTKGQAVTLNSKGVSGDFAVKDIGTNTDRVGSVVVDAANQLGSTKVGDVYATAGSSVTLNANGILGKNASEKAFTVGDVEVASNSGALTGSINLNLNGTAGQFQVGNLTAGAVIVQAGATNGGEINASSGATQVIGSINANTATVTGNSLTANTFDVTADSITYTGGLGVDTLTFAGQTAGTSNKVSVALNVSTGMNNDVVSFTTKDAAGLETTLTGTVALGDGAGDTLALKIGGTAAGSLNASGLIVTGAETITITGNAEANTIKGTAGNDRIDGKGGADIIDLSAGGSDTVVFGASLAANSKDSITGFKVGAVADGGDVLNFGAFVAVSGIVDADTNTDGVQAFVANSAATLSNGKVALVDLGSTTVADADLAAALLGTGKAFVAATDNVSATKTVLLVKNGDADVRIVYVTDAAGSDTDTVELVGVLSGVSSFTGLLDANFA